MKKIRSYAIGIILIFVVFLSPKLVNAQQIQNTGVTLKNSTNTSVLYQGGVNLDQTAIAYTTGQVEFPFTSTNVDYDSSYSFTMDYYFNVPYTSDYNSFGWGNPSLYVFSNGLIQQSLQISQFNNTLQACNALACTYRLNLAFTFATNAGGYLYLAIPVSPTHNIYGWHYNNIDLISYGQNTSNSDIINNNNQNTQNIITNNNSNTQQIINSQNQINSSINDSNTNESSSTFSNFINSFTYTDQGNLSTIITAPLRLVNSLINASNTCTPLTFPLPFVNRNATLPCYGVYLQETYPLFVDLYQLITSGLICYYVLVNTFMKVKDLKDPENDKIEVFNL